MNGGYSLITIFMLIIAKQRYIRMSPQKIRRVSRAAQAVKDPEKLISYLSFLDKRASTPLVKTIKQALANARNNMKSTGDLIIKEIQINEGPRNKRFRAGSRGRAKAIIKRTSHIRVVLETKENPKSQAPNLKQTKNSK